MRICWSWVLSAFLVIGCAGNQSTDDIIPVTTVQIKVSNNRTPEMAEPMFKLVSDRRGQVWQGRVGSSTSRKVEIPREEFVHGECFVTKVHFTGYPDINYPPFCWLGERHIDITLNPILSTSAAWAH